MIQQLHAQKSKIEQVNEGKNDLLIDAKKNLRRAHDYDEQKLHKDLVSGLFKD